MPRDAHSSAKAVDMLDLLIEFFDDGDRWIKGKLDDGAGNRCLVGALRDIRDGHNLHGAPTGWRSRTLTSTSAPSRLATCSRPSPADGHCLTWNALPDVRQKTEET
jgi:hypothetical protein